MQSTLTDKDLKEFQKQLETQLTEYDRLTSSSQEAAQTVELDQSKVGRLSRMDALQGQAMSQERNRRAKLHVIEIHLALERLQNSDFGWCEQCGENINLRRLTIEPTTLHCINCAESLENQ